LNRKFVPTFLCCLMLSSLATGLIVSVKAPVPEPIILWAVITDDPYFGYYGGYHDIFYAMKDELIKIGIDLRIAMYDDFSMYDTIWDPPCTLRPGDYDGNPETHTYGVDGWDFGCGEYWILPTGYLWVNSLVLGDRTVNSSIGGYNIMNWHNKEADYLWNKGLATLDPVMHNRYMGMWQEIFMHDPPMINMYYGELYTGMGSYVEGWDPVAYFYELSRLRINKAKFDAVAPPNRKAIGSDTWIYAVAEQIYGWNELNILTYTEDLIHQMIKDKCYTLTREDIDGRTGKFYQKPSIAADYPTWLPGPYGPNTVARVPIRHGITWSDGVPLNATDVAFTFNLLNDGRAGGESDIRLLLEEAVIVDEYTVDFVLNAPRYDFTTLWGDEWGANILPWHQLKDISPPQIKNSPLMNDWKPVSMGGQGLEGTGPYVITGYQPDVQVVLEKRDDYWGYALGWGTELPQKIILPYIPDAASRLIALQNLEVDLGDYSTAPVETWENMMTWPTHTVYSYLYPSSNPLYINCLNPILSNRYVRLAIAHAIPWKKIRDQILPGWGYKSSFYGGTFILPQTDSFNKELGDYANWNTPLGNDIPKAQMYMNMWRYSQVGTDSTKGPIGDHDFNGLVEMTDFPIWAKNIGTHSTDWVHVPTKPIDPDNDNNDNVDMSDFALWANRFGTYYPYRGAW